MNHNETAPVKPLRLYELRDSDGTNWMDGQRNATLVVVDMQPCYPSANNPVVIQNVQNAVRNFMRRGWPIVFVENHQGEGVIPTHATITELTRHYPLCHQPAHESELKVENDGSSMVEAVCAQKRFGTTRFLVCGVNTLACVLDTVRGLATRFPSSEIAVLTRGCGPTLDDESWRWFQLALPDSQDTTLTLLF